MQHLHIQLQIFKGRNFQTNIESQISAMAYLDLILRSITEPGLLQIFMDFLLIDDKFDGQRIIDVLIDRLHSADSRVRFKKQIKCKLYNAKVVQ